MKLIQLLDFYGEAEDMQRMISLFKKMKQKWRDDFGLDLPREIVEINKYERLGEGLLH